jgi:hypothetical protein
MSKKLPELGKKKKTVNDCLYMISSSCWKFVIDEIGKKRGISAVSNRKRVRHTAFRYLKNNSRAPNQSADFLGM